MSTDISRIGEVEAHATIGAYSSETNRHYPSWDALVEAEANGHVVVAVVTNGRQTWPYVMGPYPTKPEAERARSRLRSRLKREQADYPGATFTLSVRPAWKDPRDR